MNCLAGWAIVLAMISQRVFDDTACRVHHLDERYYGKVLFAKTGDYCVIQCGEPHRISLHYTQGRFGEIGGRIFKLEDFAIITVSSREAIHMIHIKAGKYPQQRGRSPQ